MALTLSLFALTVVAVVICIVKNLTVTIKNKEFGLYYVVALVGAVIVVVAGCVSPSQVFSGLTEDTAVNPIKLLVLFLSMSVLSVFLDETGFFKRIAEIAVGFAHANAKRLFTALYLTVSLCTVFTSNDVIILTFTPFIIYFCKNCKIDPLPYLVSQFAAANTFSMALVIGNPTNVYLASQTTDFLTYFEYMILPSVLSGVAVYFALRLIFRKRLEVAIDQPETGHTQIDKPLTAIGVFFLAACTLILTVSSYIGLDMWLICLGSAVLMTATVSVFLAVAKKPFTPLKDTYRRAPYELVPFVLSMFVFVLALNENGVTSAFSAFLGTDNGIVKYGAVSFLLSNLLNNIPMSVFMRSVLAENALLSSPATFAAVIGSNVGAYFSPIGALAGIMWLKILKRKDYSFSYKKFVFYLAPVSVVALASSLLGLYLSFLIV